jgi:DNA-binding MarR family transcriptional regulator
VRDLQGRLAAHGVSFGHWTFLRILWARDGLTQRELSNEAGVMESSTHVAMKAMEQLRYVKRTQVPENRKTVYVHLTSKGRTLERRLVPLAEAANRAAVRGLAASDVEAAKRVLVAVRENLLRPTRSSPRPPAPPSRTSRSSPGSRRYRPRA